MSLPASSFRSEEGTIRARGRFFKSIWQPGPWGQLIPAGRVVQVWFPLLDSTGLRKLYVIHKGEAVEIPIDVFIRKGIPVKEQEPIDIFENFEPLQLLFARTTTTYQFEEREVLGTGSFGCVKRATHPMTPGIDYAMKIMPGVDFNDLLQETNLTDLFVHDFHIAEVITYEKDVLVMLPIANRKHLGVVLQAFSRIPVHTHEFRAVRVQIFRWIYCLAKTLARVHEKGVVHRDIKPENILVHNNIIIYSDFGMARLRMNNTEPKLTSVGSTAQWAPVPQTASMESIDDECQCECGMEQLLQRNDPTPLRLGSDETQNQVLGLGEATGDVFHLGWIIYEMLLVATPIALLGMNIPCRPTAKKLAWDNMAGFVGIIDQLRTIPRPRIPGLEYENYTRLTKDLLSIVTRHMICLRADGRASSKEVASLILSAMEYYGIAPDACCSGPRKPMAKPW